MTIYPMVLGMVAILESAATAVAPLNEDYPREALERREQGLVLVRMTVGTDGRVSACKVLAAPPWSKILGPTTCDIFLTRAHFAPATGRDGRPKVSSANALVQWVIPGCAPPRQEHQMLEEKHAAVSLKIVSAQHC